VKIKGFGITGFEADMHSVQASPGKILNGIFFEFPEG
jgi:hypothetical protein